MEVWDCRSWVGEIQKIEAAQRDGTEVTEREREREREEKWARIRERELRRAGHRRRVRTGTDEQRNRNRGCIGESNFDILRVCLHSPVQRFPRVRIAQMRNVVRVAAAAAASSDFFSRLARMYTSGRIHRHKQWNWAETRGIPRTSTFEFFNFLQPRLAA